MTESERKRTIGSIETWEPEDRLFNKHILGEGSGDNTPNIGSICDVLITAIGDYSISEDQIGGYALDKALQVTLGEGDTVLSVLFDRVIMSMRDGEKCYITSKVYADGTLGSDSNLTSNRGIKFNVELTSFSRAADPHDLAIDEILDRATHHKECGTALYRARRFPFAVKRYKVALTCLVEADTRETGSRKLMSACRHLAGTCHVNLAACYLKTADYGLVESHAATALALDADNIKALYRRAMACMGLHRYVDARKDLQRALKVEPDNVTVKTELAKVAARIKDERQIYRKMFGDENVIG